MTVRYDPDKPTCRMINDSKEQLILPIMFLIASLIFFGIAAFLF